MRHLRVDGATLREACKTLAGTRLSRSPDRIRQSPEVTFRERGAARSIPARRCARPQRRFWRMGGRGVVVGGGGIGTLSLLVLTTPSAATCRRPRPDSEASTIGDPNATSDPALAQNCQTGADAECTPRTAASSPTSTACSRTGRANSAPGSAYVPARTTFFTGQIEDRGLRNGIHRCRPRPTARPGQADLDRPRVLR